MISTKVYNILLHSFLGAHISPNSIVIDLGANEGEFCGTIVKMFGCTVLAVEPLPNLFTKIESSPHIKKFNVCIAPEKKMYTIYLPKDQCASLYDGDEKLLSSKSIVVQGILFDDFLEENKIDAVDLLKVDIEGAELEMFELMKKDTFKKIKQVTVEFHDFIWPEMTPRVEKIKKHFKKNGFYCINFSLNNGDVLFVRKDVMSKFSYWYIKYFIKYFRGIIRFIKRKLG